MAVPLLDLRLQYAQVKDDVQRRIGALCDSQQFILGRAVEEIETAVRDYTGCGHAIGASSGTDALLAILMAMGIGRGDAVITTPYTFFATAGCIHRVGAEPVFVDIDAATYNMDPSKLEECLRKKCRSGPDGRLVTAAGNRVRAIMPVHLFGCVCDMDRIGALAKEFDLPVIEDAAQAIGADYPSASGKTLRAGAIGEVSYFSFFPSKNLGAFGDAGMATCRDADLASQIKLMRNHGMGAQYHHEKVGGNFRLDALQAVVLSAKLPHLDAWHAARRRNAALYREEFSRLGLLDRIDEGHDDVIFFADEGGSWQVGVDWERVLPTWFKALSATAAPGEYAERITALLSRHFKSGRDRMLALACKTATPEQRSELGRCVRPGTRSTMI